MVDMYFSWNEMRSGAAWAPLAKGATYLCLVDDELLPPLSLLLPVSDPA
jgi:hypothetical protein